MSALPSSISGRTGIPFPAGIAPPDLPPLSHPDAELLELAGAVLFANGSVEAQRERYMSACIAVAHGSPHAEREQLQADADFTAAWKGAGALAKRAARLKATTPAGLAAKAIICRATVTGAPGLAKSLAEDFLANPVLRRAIWPAEVI